MTQVRTAALLTEYCRHVEAGNDHVVAHLRRVLRAGPEATRRAIHDRLATARGTTRSALNELLTEVEKDLR